MIFKIIPNTQYRQNSLKENLIIYRIICLKGYLSYNDTKVLRQAFDNL